MLRDSKDSYDCTGWAGIEESYEGSAIGSGAFRILFSALGAIGGSNIEYSWLCISPENLFGCASMQKGEYCILNKQYTKEEYESLRKKIMNHMQEMPYKDQADRVYAYGEFFPIELSPFGYNETLAQRMFPLTKEQAKTYKYNWHEIPSNQYDININAKDLPDHIKDVSDDILQSIVGCETCGKGYRIIPWELEFLKTKNLPLPRTCPQCRINTKLDRWFMESKLSETQCAQCKTNIQMAQTVKEYSHVYCEACYIKEIA